MIVTIEQLNKAKYRVAISLLLIAPFMIGQEIEEVVVSGSFIPDEKRDTSEISAILDSSEIERTGDDNIAVALTRLTGLSLVRGKYVYVRGLGERYSAATLNGSNLPSPEPLKRVVPLDLFPTQIINSSVIQKTYSADMPGEFGGGIIEIETKPVPTERILDFSFSSGFNDSTSLDDGLLYDGGKDDDLGYDDGIRDFPDMVQQAINSNRKLDRSNFQTYELANAGREFENSKLWIIQEGDIPLDSSFNFTYGDELDISIDEILGDSSATFGVMFTAGMRSSWDTQDGIRQTGTLQAQGDGTANVIVSNDKTFLSTSNDVTSYAMSVLGITLQHDNVTFTVTKRLFGVERAGNRLRAAIGTDYSDRLKHSEYDQIVLNYGTVPLCDVYLDLRKYASNGGAVDYQALIDGKPQSIRSNPNGKFQLFRIGDAVSARNTHAAIYDALRLMKDT